MHAVWGDVDSDGDLDLYVVKWAEPNQLFRNDGPSASPRFADISREAGVDFWGYGNAATFFDYDRDGRLDLLVGNYFSETVEDPSTGQRVRNNLWNPVTTRVMHETFTHADNGGRNLLYRGVGAGGVIRFEENAESVGLTFTGWTLSVGAGDLNNDGWPDLYLANDFGPDEIYLNTGATESPPKFRLVVDPKGHPGVGNDWWKGMNVDMGDVNSDGYLDIYVTNILERRYKTDEGNMLWLNCVDPDCPGGRGFRNIAQVSGTHDGGWGWGGKFADFNLDGLLDIYTVNGFVTGDADRNYWFALQEMVTQTKNQTTDARDWPMMGKRDLSGRERGRLYLQRHNGTEAPSHKAMKPRSDEGGRRAGAPSGQHPSFVEAAERSGITDVYNGRGIALADFDHDGDLDMYIANQGAPSTYYVNQTLPGTGPSQSMRGAVGAARGQAGFLWFELEGRPDWVHTVGQRLLASTRNAVGARVILTTRTGRQFREVQGGMGFASQSEYAVHFGVPGGDAVVGLEIRWPSGRVQEFAGDRVQSLLNRHSHITEGESEARTW